MNALVLQERDQIPVAAACEALGISRATLYRAQQPKVAAPPPAPRQVPRKLSSEERERIVALLHSEEFVDQPPGEIVAELASRGVYVASVRTFYRILATMGELRERRAQRQHPPALKPSLTATGPNQVWTWDITKVAGLGRGVFFYVYVLIDLFSRYVVGWLAAARENGVLAANLLEETLVAHAVDPTQLVVHSDRGSPMTSESWVQLCALLGVERSYGRPHVSDDNPFSEAQFKTMKYQPDYPGRFGSVLHVRGWMASFFGWHNGAHHHSGLAMFTPAEVYFGRFEEVAAVRQQALDTAYAAHPERFVHGPPQVRRPPAAVHINPAVPTEAPDQGADPACPTPVEPGAAIQEVAAPSSPSLVENSGTLTGRRLTDRRLTNK